MSEYTNGWRESKTYKISNTPVGNVYITLSYNGGIKEIFVRVGKSKMDYDNNIFELQGLVNGLSIMISKMLQDGGNINRIIESLENINTGWTVFRWNGYHIRSLSDLIAKVIKFDILQHCDINVMGVSKNTDLSNFDNDNEVIE